MGHFEKGKETHEIPGQVVLKIGTRNVSFVFEHSYSCMQALIDQGVIGDFRAPNIMRFGITPLFINMDDIERATQIFEQILSDKTWQKPQFQNRSRVT